MRRKHEPGCGCDCGAGGGGGTPCGGSPATYVVAVRTCGYPRPGVTVTATGPGGVISATSDASGNATLSLPAGGAYTISAAAPTSRFVDTPGGTVTVVCGGTSGATLALTPAPGTHCCVGYWDPLPDRLYYTDGCVSGHVDWLGPSSCAYQTWLSCTPGLWGITFFPYFTPDPLDHTTGVWRIWEVFTLGLGGSPIGEYSDPLSSVTDPVNFTCQNTDFPTQPPNTYFPGVCPITITE